MTIERNMSVHSTTKHRQVIRITASELIDHLIQLALDDPDGFVGVWPDDTTAYFEAGDLDIGGDFDELVTLQQENDGSITNYLPEDRGDTLVAKLVVERTIVSNR